MDISSFIILTSSSHNQGTVECKPGECSSQAMAAASSPPTVVIALVVLLILALIGYGLYMCIFRPG